MGLYVFVILVLFVSRISCIPSEGCGISLTGNYHPGQHHTYKVQVPDPNVGEVEREYILHLPASFDSSNNVPVPMVIDYHWWGGSANSQISNTPWTSLADSEGFVYVSMEGMSDAGNWTGSWNVSATQGPLGPTCDTEIRPPSSRCYTSCGDCSYLENSCDWTSCHDDVTYTESVLYDILASICVDTDQMHVTGRSNGGSFIWSKIMDRLAATFASAGTACSSPLRGYNPMPDSPMSIIDFHGLLDDVIPASPNSPENLGPGPDDTTKNIDGFYYHIKLDHLMQVAESMNCAATPEAYPTHMDGVDGWSCQRWSGCEADNEIVFCTGDHGHDYPFSGHYIDGLSIMWDFMKTHKNSI